MARILFIDDKFGVCENIKEKLGVSHQVEAIAKTLWSDASKEAQSKLIEPWDVLVLDMHYDSQHNLPHQGDFGGIWLYNELVKLGFRSKWRHTIVYSRHVPPDWNAKSEGAALALRVFLNTADIPYDCAVPNDAVTPDNLNRRIADLIALDKHARELLSRNSTFTPSRNANLLDPLAPPSVAP